MSIATTSLSLNGSIMSLTAHIVSDRLACETRFLLAGHDTAQSACYLHRSAHCTLDFTFLAIEKERMRQTKQRDACVQILGGMAWSLKQYGSGPGYPLVMESADFKVEFGEFNSPSFFVTRRSQARWGGVPWLCASVSCSGAMPWG